MATAADAMIAATPATYRSGSQIWISGMLRCSLTTAAETSANRTVVAVRAETTYLRGVSHAAKPNLSRTRSALGVTLPASTLGA